MTSIFANVEFDGTTLLTGYALGTFGVVAYVLALFVQSSTGTGSGDLAATAGYATAVIGTPLLAGLTAGNLASTGGYTAGEVLSGYAVGGLIFGVAVGWMNSSISNTAAGSGTVQHVLIAAALTLSVPLAAVAGAAVGRRIGGSDDVSASAA